jgi:hypothetical protein
MAPSATGSSDLFLFHHAVSTQRRSGGKWVRWPRLASPQRALAVRTRLVTRGQGSFSLRSNPARVTPAHTPLYGSASDPDHPTIGTIKGRNQEPAVNRPPAIDVHVAPALRRSTPDAVLAPRCFGCPLLAFIGLATAEWCPAWARSSPNESPREPSACSTGQMCNVIPSVCVT